MTERKRFLLVVPVFQSVYAKPFANFLAMMLNAATNEGLKYQFAPHVPERESLPSLMNKACETVLSLGLDGMIVADDDCQPPFDAISRLMRRYEDGHQIVLGLGFMRDPPHTTTVGRYFKEGPTLITNPKNKTVEWTGFQWLDNIFAEDTNDGLVSADFGGFPIALISKEAIEKMQRPWFGLELEGGSCTHDVYFGKRAEQAGIPIVVDTHIPCGHLQSAQWVTFGNRDIVRRVNDAWRAHHAQAVQ